MYGHENGEAADIDWARFTAQADNTYTFAITNEMGGNYYFRVCDAEYRSLSGNKTSNWTWTCPVTGTYYVQMWEYGNDAIGSFDFSIINHDAGADEISPTCGVSSPEENAILTCEQVSFSGMAADNSMGTGVVKVELCLDNECPDTWHEAQIEGQGPNVIWSYAGNNLAGGDHIVKIRATDQAGNVQQDLTICNYKIDCAAPVPDIDSLPALTGQCEVTITTLPKATDNFAGQITGSTNDPLTYTEQNTYIITWTYDDGHGNSVTQTQTVIVKDTQPPVPDITILPALSCQYTIELTPPGATDNCMGPISAIPIDPSAYIAAGTYTLPWMYDDGHGNTANQEQTLIFIGPWEIAAGMQYSMVSFGIAFDGQEFAANGDWLGAFGPNGIDDCRACGKAQENGFYYLNIGGEIEEEEIIFKLFRNADNQVLGSSETILFVSNMTLENKDIYFGMCMQEITIIKGWNWVSFNVLPSDTSLEALFGDHTDFIEQVKTQTQSATNIAGLGWIGDNLSLMSNIAKGIMFKIRAKEDFTLTIAGQSVNPDLPINLFEGWSWIAYLPRFCMPVESAVDSIFDDLYQIKSQAHSKTKMTDDLFIGDLIEMCPNRGYTVKMDVEGTLIYPTTN